MILAIIVSLFLQTDVPADTILLSEVEIIAQIKQHGDLSQQPISATSINFLNIERKRINEPKNLSLITPNLYLPDYGSKMTGSLYIRGIGTRIEQPAMGLYIDNVPILNKNNYDFDYFDIRRIDILRGPQGTLYGRNAIGGVINIYTLSPFYYDGIRISAGYGSKNSFDAHAAIYKQCSDKLGLSLSLKHNKTDGFFTNVYDNSKSDNIISNGLRTKLHLNISEKWTLENFLSINRVEQSGFSYSLYDENSNIVFPINHNDICSYERIGLINGTSFLFKNNNISFSSATGFQFTDDKMVLDQDFSTKSMFTITQSQIENAITQELVLKSNNIQNSLQWLVGFFGFYKHLEMDAPVTFKQDGINELILDNANKGIQTVFPNAMLFIEEKEFIIESFFKMPVYALSTFVQTEYRINNLKLTAGIRFDYENSVIKYNNSSDINYRFSLTMPNYKPLSTKMNSNENISFFELMPRFSALYSFNENNNVYFVIARGYKTGGYNTQIFSDILQNKMMENSMSDLGVYFSDNLPYNTSDAILYKPEYIWNYEIGSRFTLFENMLNSSFSCFYIDCKNQQLTVFPPGKSTGRLMSNAGQSRSYGFEVSLNFNYSYFNLTSNYGYTDARFVSYIDGFNDFAKKYVPYAPQNTVSIIGDYYFKFNKNFLDGIILQADWQGVGKIYWNETNSIVQPFYGQIGTSVFFKKNKISVALWGKNLTDKQFNTFYFKSVGNSFVQRGKPFRMGISFSVDI